MYHLRKWAFRPKGCSVKLSKSIIFNYQMCDLLIIFTYSKFR